MNPANPFGEVIFSYSRKQAIEDGVLVDLSQVETIQRHWKYPFACSAGVWAAIQQALQEDGQDLTGICHDISMMAKNAFGTTPEADQLFFKVIIGRKTHALKLHIGAGDTLAPVLTLMFPDED